MPGPAVASVSINSHAFSDERKKPITQFSYLGNKELASFVLVFQLMAKYPVSVFPSSWMTLFLSSFPLPPSTMAGESGLMDKFCHSSLFSSTSPSPIGCYRSWSTFLQQIKYIKRKKRRNTYSKWKETPFASQGLIRTALKPISQWLTESYCVLNLHSLKQRNLLTPTSATDSFSESGQVI